MFSQTLALAKLKQNAIWQQRKEEKEGRKLIDTHLLNKCALYFNLDLYIVIGLASPRSYKIGVVGNNWLVGKAVFSETALRIFLIFCIKLGDYKGRKVTEPDF